MENTAPDSEYMQTPAACAYVGLSRTTLLTAVYARRLKAHQPGGVKGKWLFKRHDLDAWITSR